LKNNQNQRTASFEYLKKNQNPRTASSSYFKNLKEPPGFMKELEVFWAVI
jgi:hypothetical protein